MASPRVLVLRAPGSNCDGELIFAFEHAGATVQSLHVNRLRENPSLLQRFQILAIPGGFSFGDDVAAGRLFALQLTTRLGEALREFRDRGNLCLGVCNGFQVLLRTGLLIPPDDDGPLATLGPNTSGRFGDRWIQLKATPGQCAWLMGVEAMRVPVAHGEGRFVARQDWIMQGLRETNQLVLHYVNGTGQPTQDFPANPNGSQDAVAGVCDASGRFLGLMPHPERNVLPTHDPLWTRNGLRPEGDGARLFRNGVAFFR